MQAIGVKEHVQHTYATCEWPIVSKKNSKTVFRWPAPLTMYLYSYIQGNDPLHTCLSCYQWIYSYIIDKKLYTKTFEKCCVWKMHSCPICAPESVYNYIRRTNVNFTWFHFNQIICSELLNLYIQIMLYGLNCLCISITHKVNENFVKTASEHINILTQIKFI